MSGGQVMAAAARLQFPNARPMEIIGDSMAPTLRRGRDIAMVVPVPAYVGEGVYVIESMPGCCEIYRADAFAGRGTVKIWHDNKHYEPQQITMAQFNELVLGKVVGKVEFYDHEAYRSCVSAMRCAHG